jgi:hypothetical protein
VKPIEVGGYTNPMTDRSRVAITLATALALGAFAYGSAFDIHLPGVLQDIWDRSGLAVYGLAIVGVFLVYRWWALLPAIIPIAIMIYLYTMTNYVPRFEDQGVPASPWFLLLAIVGIGVHAAVLSIGLLLRAVWESVRSRRRRGVLPDSA